MAHFISKVGILNADQKSCYDFHITKTIYTKFDNDFKTKTI